MFRRIPRFHLRTLFIVTALVAVSLASLKGWYRWYYEDRMTSFSTWVELGDSSQPVPANGRYRFTVKPNQENPLLLGFLVTVENHFRTTHHSNTIHLKLRNHIDKGYDFVINENVFVPQTMLFDDDDMIRFYWVTEPIDHHRTAIHSAAIHFRHGRLLETRTETLEVEFSVDQTTDVHVDQG